MNSDIKLDSVTHDLTFEADDLVLFTQEQDSIRQRLKIGLATIAGEWFLDIDKGLPITSSNFSQKGSQTLLDAYIRRFISEFEGVQELLTYRSELDRTTRTSYIFFTARVDSGEILSFEGAI